eukprot:2404589-Rhodomonas_salina.1
MVPPDRSDLKARPLSLGQPLGFLLANPRPSSSRKCGLCALAATCSVGCDLCSLSQTLTVQPSTSHGVPQPITRDLRERGLRKAWLAEQSLSQPDEL